MHSAKCTTYVHVFDRGFGLQTGHIRFGCAGGYIYIVCVCVCVCVCVYVCVCVCMHTCTLRVGCLHTSRRSWLNANLLQLVA